MTATAVLGAAAGNAVAYWSEPGSGTASGQLMSPTAITVSAAGVDGLVPGGAALSVDLTVDNHGSMAFAAENLTPVVSGGSADCPARVVAATPPPTLPVVVAGGTTAVHVQVAMSPDAPASCQGVSFVLTVAVDGRWL